MNMEFEKQSARMLRVNTGNAITVLQISDVHYDSQTCDRAMLTKHLKEAESRGALVFINGDWFDLMQGKWDPRGSYSGLRPEYKYTDYLDRVISDSAEYLSKFKVKYIIGLGNHETNIIKRMHTNPISTLCMMLREKGNDAIEMGYDGYIKYCFDHKGSNDSLLQYFHHGSGGNAPRSKGIMTADIDQQQSADADLITKGHDHNKWSLPITVERVNNRGYIHLKTVWHLRTGSYQGMPDYGWPKEKKFAQPTLGGWWTTMTSRLATSKHDGQKRERVVEVTIQSAD